MNYRLVSSKNLFWCTGDACITTNQPQHHWIGDSWTPSGPTFWLSLVWTTMMILIMVSLFDQFVPFSSFEWKAKIWIGSHLILQYYFSRKRFISIANEKPGYFPVFWLDDENSTSMLKNRICPGNKPRLFWVMFKLMIFQNFKNFHPPQNLKNFAKSTWSSSQSFQACSFYCLHFDFRSSDWSIFFGLWLDDKNLFGAIKDLVLYFSIFCPKKPKFGRLAMLAILELTFEGFKHMFKILNPWSHP